jgi:hypothetical protein
MGVTGIKKSGETWLELILWFFFIVPGFIYSMCRIGYAKRSCAMCGSLNVIPWDTPAAQKIIKQLDNP